MMESAAKKRYFTRAAFLYRSYKVAVPTEYAAIFHAYLFLFSLFALKNHCMRHFQSCRRFIHAQVRFYAKPVFEVENVTRGVDTKYNAFANICATQCLAISMRDRFALVHICAHVICATPAPVTWHARFFTTSRHILFFSRSSR